MKHVRLVIIALLFLTSMSFMEAQTMTKNNHKTNVTKSMVRKIKNIYDADEVFRRTFNDWYDCRSWSESYEKMNEIMANPNLAKPIIYHIFGFYGTGDIGYIHFTRSYGFTDSEYNIALDIYDEKYHFRQREAEENARKIQEENLHRQKLQQAADSETMKLNEWKQNGSPFFSEFPHETGTHPKLEINFDEVVKRCDMSSNSPKLDEIAESQVVLEILQDKSINNIKTSGNLTGMLLKEDISVIEPVKFYFKHIDTKYPISCNYTLDLSDSCELLDDIKCKVKYNKKNNLWEIEVLDYTSFLGIKEDIYSYEKLYKKTKYNKVLSTSAKDAIASAIAKAINNDPALREKLIKGKHTIGCSVYNHWLRFNHSYYDLQPFVDHIEIL